jgi:integrase
MMNRAIIDDKKVKAIYSYIETLRNGKQLKMMFDFSFLGAMRSVNFRNLQLKDVIDEYNNIKDIIVLDSEKNKGKNKAKYYVSDELKKSIKEYIRDFDLNNKETYLFISPKTGKPYSRTHISTMFSNVFNVFGLDCSTHYGRRRGITKLLTEKGVDITTVKTLVNHKNIATTSLYVNEDENLLKTVVNSLNK